MFQIFKKLLFIKFAFVRILDVLFKAFFGVGSVTQLFQASHKGKKMNSIILIIWLEIGSLDTEF